MLQRVLECLAAAVADEETKRRPASELRRCWSELAAAPSDGPWPYFISDDERLCTALSVVNCVHQDRERRFAAGFSIQASATAEPAFAKPYYVDPTGHRRCKNLVAAERYEPKGSWTYDASFVGWCGPALPEGCRGHAPRYFRTQFVAVLQSDIARGSFSDLRLYVRTNDTFFFSSWPLGESERDRLSETNQYLESLRESKVVLCPRGVGNNTIRFFETIAAGSIPLYIGDRQTRFPLDWIIDWERLCFRIDSEDCFDGSYAERIRTIVGRPAAEIEARRDYASRMYHQFLAPERKSVFESLVLVRARHLLERHARV